MLKNSLHYIPQITLLRSDKILNKLIISLLGDSPNDSFQEIHDGVRDFYPNSYRLDEMELSLSQKSIQECGIDSDFDFKKFSGLDYNFSFLGELYKKFFTQNGANIYVKEESLESYIGFITKVTPFQIMGYKLAKEIKENELCVNDVWACVRAYTPLGLKVNGLKEYAENHLHFKGAGYLAFNFTKLISQPTPHEYYTQKILKEIPRINEFSYINNHTISIGQVVDILKFCKDYIYASFMDDALKKKEREKYKTRLHKIMTYNEPTGEKYGYSIDTISQMSKMFPIFQNTIEENMLKEIIVFYDEGEYSKAYFMENVLFFYLFDTTKEIFLRYIIKLHIHATNILRSYMVMSQNLGLAHFSEYSGSTLREVNKQNAHSNAGSIIKSGTTHLNAKVGTPETSDKILRNILIFKNAFDRHDSTLKFNFGLSTVKNREKDIITPKGTLHPRFYKKRKKIKLETLAIDDFMRNVKYKNMDKFSTALKFSAIDAYKQKSKLEGEVIDISSFVVSIDAVGKETHTAPEVFAPHFRYLRNAPKQLNCNIFSNICRFDYHQNLIITVHAGEDFNHIVTGMRRVDECINFFGMHRRDRLGHVLSLGITPYEWKESVQEIMVYKGEHFDDLVWLCQKLKQISCSSLSLAKYISIYEDKIWELFFEIYPNYSNQSLHISDLYKAWQYRKNCPIVFEQRERGEFIYGSYEKCVLDKEEPSKVVRELYTLYQTCPDVRKAYTEVYKIKKEDIKKEELHIWEALQDSMLEEIAQRGIVIETNPSSNVFISSLDSYDFHPIFRFNPPKDKYLKKGKKFNKYGQRNGKVSITINSDDPAIFVTSLQNEYRTIKNIAIAKYKCSDKEADDWLNDIRKFGLQIFNETYSLN